MSKPSVLAEFERSDLVVTVKLVSVDKLREKQGQYDIHYVKSAKMIVEKVYKGQVKVGDELTLAQGSGADCIWTFGEELIGKKFLFYLGEPTKDRPFSGEKAAENAESMYYAVTCGRSSHLEYAFDDLLFLDKIDKVRGKSRISGTLASWDTKAPSFADLKIKIIGQNKTYVVKTDKNGVYEIYDLPPGEYLIELPVPKGWKINYRMMEYLNEDRFLRQNSNFGKNQISVILEEKLEEKGHASLDVLFVMDNSIRGKVLSPSGKPLENVCVMAVSTELADGDYRGRFGCTDQTGAFLIEELSTGNYHLAVNDDGQISSSEPFGTLFFPGVADRREAAVVSIDVGKFLNDVVIQIPKMFELIEIKGRLLYSDGNPVDDESVEFTPAPGSTATARERARTDAEGRFTLKVVKGTSGTLSSRIFTYLGKFENCAELDRIINESGKKYLDVQAAPVEIEGSAGVPDVKVIFPFPRCAKASQAGKGS